MSLILVAKSIFKNPGNRGRYLEKTLKAVSWQINKRTLKRNWILNLKNGLKFKAYPDCVVSSSLVYSDFPEYREILFLRKFLNKNDCIIDIGANVGHISLLLADIVNPENIYMFEPTPVSFSRLQENWNLNGFVTDNLYHCAVGSRNSTVFIENTDSPATTNSVSSGKTDNSSVEVEQVTLDSNFDLWKEKRIGLIKIDVEGYEREVLEGARKLIQIKRPRVIMFESLGNNIDPQIQKLFSDLNYRLFQLDDTGKKDLLNLDSQNLFAEPQENIS